MLTGLEGRLEYLGGGMVSTDQLDHDIDLGVCDNLAPIGGEHVRLEPQLLAAGLGSGTGLGDAQVHAVGGEVVLPMALQETNYPAADGA